MRSNLTGIFIAAAKAAGHPVQSISGDREPVEKINWVGAEPDSATQAAILVQAEAAERKGLVSTECRRRIYAVASQETQSNMALAQGQVSAKATSSRTAAETAILDGIAAALGWVTAMRATYATLSTGPDTDFETDAAWPDCPAEAVAVVDQF